MSMTTDSWNSPTSSSDNFRVTASGNIAGLLTGTPTFTSLFYGSQERKEAKKLLYSLQGGSSSALKAFKEVVFCAVSCIPA